MGSPRNNHPSFTSFSAVEEEEISQKPRHGITSILESDDQRTKSTLCKTLSTDMSSKRWQTQNGFSSILADENNNKNSRYRYLFSDVWASNLTQKTSKESKSASLPPYIHPLVKRAAHSLSYQSLQICTESLGSETGLNEHKSFSETSSDAENGPEEELCLHKRVNIIQSFEKEISHEKYNSGRSCRRTGSQSFPPPLPSLSCRDGGSVHIRKCSESGRMVLEAISIPSQKNFQAQREDGCLILTFADKTSSNNEASDDHGEVFKQDKDFFELYDVKELINPESDDEDTNITYEEDEEEEEEKEEELDNQNISRESRSFRNDSYQVVKSEIDDGKQIRIPQSLPSQPILTMMISKQPTCLTASSYKDEYILLTESQGVNNITKTIVQQSPGHEHCSDKCIIKTSPISTQQKELLSAKQNKPCCSSTALNSCKEPKRPLLYSDHKWITIS